MILNHKTLNHGEILIWHLLSMLTTFDDFGFSISSFKRDSTSWEMPSKLPFSPPTISTHWGLVTECCPFLTNNLQGIWGFKPPPHAHLDHLQLEASGSLALLWVPETWLWRLLQCCCKFCLGMSLGHLMEALNKDTFQILDSAIL